MICDLKTISIILTLISTINSFTQAEQSNERIHDELSKQNYRFLANFNTTNDDVGVCLPNKTLERVTKRNDELNLVKLGKNYFTQEQFEMAEIFFYQNESRDTLPDTTISRFAFGVASVKLISQRSCDYFAHKYDSYQDIKRASGPQVDQELCLKQLEYLNMRLNRNHRLGVQSEDLNFAHYMAAFGTTPRDVLVGNVFSVGAFDACKQMQIVINKRGEYSAAKYCVGLLRYKDWPSEDPLDKLLAVKTGLCLPEACDSLNYKNKFELIKRLSDYDARQQVFGNRMQLTAVYCPPDGKSELGAWWRSKPTLVTVGLTGLWLLILIAATIIDESNERRRSIKLKKLELEKATGKIGPVAIHPRANKNLDRICRSLSIISNFRFLFSTGKSSLMEVQMQRKVINAPAQPIKLASEAKIVNLDIVDGIKVLASMYVISGHVVMLLPATMSNLRDLGTSQSVAWTLSYSIPAFVINIFFSITGILISYRMFKQSQSEASSSITSPIKWIDVILHRYVRIMPMYALVTSFCKHVARYIGDGPFWDHGTSFSAARRNCEQEHWAWTLLLVGNFKLPLKLCIPSAWYLANDFQFFLVTPIFLATLQLRPKLGRALLILFTVVGYLSGVRSIFGVDLYDMRPIGQLKPHGFMIYANFLHGNYTQPQNRIPAYLIGLLLGHLLFEYEQRKKDHLARVESGEVSGKEATPGWSKRMKRFGPLFSLFVVVAILITPSVASRLTVSREFGRHLFAIILPALHLVCSIAGGIYILLAATGHGNQQVNLFLSSKFWKPLSRLGLCVMLVNIEVIVYITQTSRVLHHMDNQNLTSLMVMSSIYTYIVAMIAFVLFEAPIQSAISYFLSYLSSLLSKMGETMKKRD